MWDPCFLCVFYAHSTSGQPVGRLNCFQPVFDNKKVECNHQTTADFSQSDLTQVWRSIWRINQVYRWPWAIQKELCFCLNHCWGKKQLMWLSLWLCWGWLFWREGESLKLHEMWYAVVRHESLSQVYCCKFLPVLLLLLTILPSPFPSPAFDILTAAGAEFWISQQTR